MLTAWVGGAPAQTPERKALANLSLPLAVPPSPDRRVHLQVVMREIHCANAAREPDMACLGPFGRNKAGGFVFTAESGTIDTVICALQVQERVKIWSRNNTVTPENTPALIKIGQDLDLFVHRPITGVGPVRKDDDTRSVGGMLKVTPRISEDGRFNIQLIAEVYSVLIPYVHEEYVVPKNIPTERLQAKVTVADGETVVLGGKITRMRVPTEGAVPFLSDIAYIGHLFCFRTHTMSVTQPLILVTPHIVLGDSDCGPSQDQVND
jgi:general secretion pathway protein D